MAEHEISSRLISLVEAPFGGTSESTIICDGVPNGEHDNFLSALTYWTSKQWGFSEEANKALLDKGPLAVLQDPDTSNPYTEADLTRIARSGASKGTSKPLKIVEERNLRCANDLLSQPPIEWAMWRFVPQNKLSFQYGTGGIGKSTWVPWLVGELLKKGMVVGFSATEETFDHFSNGVRLGMRDSFKSEYLDNLFDLGNDWNFPKDEEKLSDLCIEYKFGFIYFDSIYDTFDAKAASSLTASTRPSLTPLSRIAETMKVSILGTFHETKQGDFNGSKDMENIPRVLIHAEAEAGQERLRLYVKKSNYKKPDYDLLTIGEWVPETNLDGSPVMERSKAGVLEQSLIYVVYGFEEVERKAGTPFDLAKIKEVSNTSNDDAYWKVLECKNANPTFGWRQISEATGLKENIVKMRMKNLEQSEE